ncbi:MAG: GTP-binding protein [Candidatus Lokiarchaeota archaeon]|nr:GTP-binding protein [Candidatus Lokiarchaeota archaeon]
MSNNQDFDYLFKVIVIGDGGVGKTALTTRFSQGIFRDQYKMTIGVDFSIKTIDVNGKSVKLQIWDTGGQERFAYIRPLYYKGAAGSLFVFDLTNRKSFDNLNQTWFDEVFSNCGNDLPWILVGNKADLTDREVSREEAEAFANKYNVKYIESSAKSGKSVNESFFQLTRLLIEDREGTGMPTTKEAMAQTQQATTQTTEATQAAQNTQSTTADQEQQAEAATQEVDQQAYLKNLENYKKLSNVALSRLQAGDTHEARNLFKQAYEYAKRVNFEDGMTWLQDQISYCIKLIEQAKKQEKKKSYHMICNYCEKKYSVPKKARYRCPKCGTELEPL